MVIGEGQIAIPMATAMILIPTGIVAVPQQSTLLAIQPALITLVLPIFVAPLILKVLVMNVSTLRSLIATEAERN